jgi:mannose-1-phosphate guanylyltransferase/mannose-6-phosphate isomerase
MPAVLSHNYALILAGGQGSRFWPQSRTLEPKQFLSLHQRSSLFEQTIKRISPLIKAKNIFIATSELYRHQILEFSCRLGIPEDNIIFEPEGKNTAPSIAVAVKLIHLRDSRARIAVLPCDHLIRNDRNFVSLLKRALEVCTESLVIFGIPPHRPATGYGYIKAKNEKREARNAQGIMQVERFCEKPDLVTAKKFLASGGYYWNSGIFVGSSEVFLGEFSCGLPELFAQLRKVNTLGDIPGAWKKIQPISFDYGILERSKKVLMLAACDLGWSDLGSWQAWDEVIAKDKEGNSFKADVVNIASRNTTVLGSSRLVATIGLDDLIIVDTPDALLITKKERSEEVKKIVDLLKAGKRQEHYTHKTVKRPWGAYTVLELGDGFKVKLVEVRPRHALSLQLHKKRSEHWVVVEGKARITRGKKSFIFQANQSTYIPVNCVHRLENPAGQPLKIIEVQAGRYLEEDDIVRIKDDFGRK